LFFIGSIALIFGIYTLKPNVRDRIVCLLSLAFLMGNNLGPLIAFSMEIDPLIPLQATLLTSVIFSCFTLASMLADRKTLLYFYSLVSSAAMTLLFSTLFFLFYPTDGLLNLIMAASMLVWCGYIVYDTEIMLARLSIGQQDFVDDALQLFLDFLQLFVRILQILSKLKKKDK